MLDMFGKGYAPPTPEQLELQRLQQQFERSEAMRRAMQAPPQRSPEDSIREMRQMIRPNTTRPRQEAPQMQQPTPADGLPPAPKAPDPPLRSVLKRGDWA